MIIAQISDMHVKPRGAKAFGTVDTNAFLAAAVRQINAAAPRPDVVLATGDLVDKGTAEEYAALAELLQPLIPPLYVIPGRSEARRVGKEWSVSVDLGGRRIIKKKKINKINKQQTNKTTK